VKRVDDGKVQAPEQVMGVDRRGGDQHRPTRSYLPQERQPEVEVTIILPKHDLAG
jgi:hypothetical protein